MKIKTWSIDNEYAFDTHCRIGFFLLFIVSLQSWCFYMDDMVHHQFFYCFSMNILTISILILSVYYSVYLESIYIKFVYIATIESIEDWQQCDRRTVVSLCENKNKRIWFKRINFGTTQLNFTQNCVLWLCTLLVFWSYLIEYVGDLCATNIDRFVFSSCSCLYHPAWKCRKK